MEKEINNAQKMTGFSFMEHIRLTRPEPTGLHNLKD